MLPRIAQPAVPLMAIAILMAFRLIPVDFLGWWPGASTSTSDQAFTSEDPVLVQLRQENARLSEELNLIDTSQSFLTAKVLNKTVASFREAVRIGAGEVQGLAVDQPVFSQGYLVGRVFSVEPQTATVLLLGDPDIRIPVVIGNARGIVVAQAGGVVIDQVVGEVAKGQNVLSSGVGGLYPPGQLVGTVGEELERDIFTSYVLSRPVNTAELFELVVGLGAS